MGEEKPILNYRVTTKRRQPTFDVIVGWLLIAWLLAVGLAWLGIKILGWN
jgi:hypothetical protein